MRVEVKRWIWTVRTTTSVLVRTTITVIVSLDWLERSDYMDFEWTGLSTTWQHIQLAKITDRLTILRVNWITYCIQHKHNIQRTQMLDCHLQEWGPILYLNVDKHLSLPSLQQLTETWTSILADLVSISSTLKQSKLKLWCIQQRPWNISDWNLLSFIYPPY